MLVLLGNIIIVAWVTGVIVLLCVSIFGFKGKLGISLAVASLCLFIGLPAHLYRNDAIAHQQAVNEQAERTAYFEQRCKSSGYFIHKKITGVQGIEILKMRPETYGTDQFERADPFGRDGTGDDYIATFLRGYSLNGTVDVKDFSNEMLSLGFDFVDVSVAKGNRSRYTSTYVFKPERPARPPNFTPFKAHHEFKLSMARTNKPRAKYGITFDDISTDEDLKRWVAGSSLKIVDLKTQEVVAERVGYLMDPGFGARGGGRQPWNIAVRLACPSFEKPGEHVPAPNTQGQARRFADIVLRNIDNHNLKEIR